MAWIVGSLAPIIFLPSVLPKVSSMPTVFRSGLKKRHVVMRAVTKADSFVTTVFSALPRLELAVFMAFVIGGTLASLLSRQ